MPCMGAWAERARAITRQLAGDGVVEVRDQGYADSLLAAGIALDLAIASAQAGQIEYARRGWSAALQLLTPAPVDRPRPAAESGEGVQSVDAEFAGIAASFYAQWDADRAADIPHTEEP